MAARSSRRGVHRARSAAAVMVLALLWGIATPSQVGAVEPAALGSGSDDTIELHATDDGAPPEPRRDADEPPSVASSADRVGAGADAVDAAVDADRPDLVPGVLRVLSQRFSYGGFDATVVSVRLLGVQEDAGAGGEPADPSHAVRISASAGPPTGTTVPPALPPAAAPAPAASAAAAAAAGSGPTVAVRAAASTARRGAAPIVQVKLRVRNITPTQGRLTAFRLRAGRSVYLASDVQQGQVDAAGGSEMVVEFHPPRAATALLDSAMLVVGAPGTSQAAVPLGRHAPEPSVRHPRAVVETLRSTVFGPGDGYTLGSFEVYRVEYGASVARLDAPDAGMRWLGIEYGLCVQGTVAPVRPTLVLDDGSIGLTAVGIELRAGVARGSLPMAPSCPGWSTALAHWEVPLGTEGTVRIDLVDDAPRPHVVGNLHLEVPSLPAESAPPAQRPCPP